MEFSSLSTSWKTNRRFVLGGLAGISMTSARRDVDAATVQVLPSRTLVAYFSRSGNTRVIAAVIQRALNANIHGIRPAEAYPEDYLQTVEQAREERDQGLEPALLNRVSDLSAYDTVFLGFPIWGETAPPVIRSFLSTHDLSAKTLIPFITHGGYGLGNSLSVLRAHAPRARLLDAGFSMEADQERRTLNEVTSWLKALPTRDRTKVNR
jgi:flavodoxin